MSAITNSPDITQLETQVTWDISGSIPVINLVNMSVGPNLSNVTWWVVALSPSQTPIHDGSSATPDAVGAWNTLSLTDSWPRPFSQIEFSGAPYLLTLYAQDSNGNIYSIDKSVSICRPIGNTQNSKNYYGVSSTEVKVLCQQAGIFFEDKTSVSYQGNPGTRTSSNLKVIYPLDPTYSIPAPFQISNFSNAIVPITYSSTNYQFLAYSTYDYDFGNYCHVAIKYQQLETFSVLCNIDLLPLVCEVNKLIQSIEFGTCADVNSATQKLNLITPKLSLVFIGIMQPLTGVDVPKLIDEIKAIGGFDCDCCSASSGIIPQTSSVIDGYTFSINPICGDINGTVTQVGTNIQFNLQDNTYIFNIGNHAGTTAFTVSPATNTCTKTYSLNVDITQLSTDILTTISTNPGLVNLLNSLVTNSNQNLTVNGKCVFTSTATFAYTFSLANIPTNTTFAIVTGIQIGPVTTPINFTLNLTNLAAFQSYLNTLGIGTFVVTNPSGQNVLIATTANPNALTNLTYSISSVSYTASQTSSSTGYTQLTANQVVQSIIDYLCGLDDAEITTSQNYAIWYINSSGQKVSTTVTAGSTLNNLISILLGYQEQTIDNINSIGGGVSCVALKAVFTVNQGTIGANDFIFATKNGNCSQVGFQDAFLNMISNMSNAAKAAFCNAVVACGAGLSCSPYNYLVPIVSTYSTSCSPIIGMEISLS